MPMKLSLLSGLPMILMVACGAAAGGVEHISVPSEVAGERAEAAQRATAGASAGDAVELTSEPESVLAALHCTAKPCVAPKAFVETLCAKKNPDAAVALFAAAAPLPRRFIRMQAVDSINPLGPSSTEKLNFDEEVVVLDGANADPKKLSVSGANGHNVLRFDGTCAAVMDDELTNKRPPAPHHAQLVWSHLDSSIQDALLADAKVKKARREQRASCGATSTSSNVDARCVETRLRLADAVASAIQSPLALPDVHMR